MKRGRADKDLWEGRQHLSERFESVRTRNNIERTQLQPPEEGAISKKMHHPVHQAHPARVLLMAGKGVCLSKHTKNGDIIMKLRALLTVSLTLGTLSLTTGCEELDSVQTLAVESSENSADETMANPICDGKIDCTYLGQGICWGTPDSIVGTDAFWPSSTRKDSEAECLETARSSISQGAALFSYNADSKACTVYTAGNCKSGLVEVTNDDIKLNLLHVCPQPKGELTGTGWTTFTQQPGSAAELYGNDLYEGSVVSYHCSSDRFLFGDGAMVCSGGVWRSIVERQGDGNGQAIFYENPGTLCVPNSWSNEIAGDLSYYVCSDNSWTNIPNTIFQCGKLTYNKGLF